MTDLTPENSPKITLFFSIGIIGMDENVTEYVELPLVDIAADEGLQKQLGMKAQLAQLKLQVGFIELMSTQFPVWAAKKFKEEGWELPEDFFK